MSGGVQVTVRDWRVVYSSRSGKGITIWNRSIPGCWTRVAWVRNRWYAEALAEGWGDDGHDLLEALGTALARLAEQQGALLR